MKHIIWDFNGTLLNDAQLSVDLDNDVFDQIGVPRITLEDYRNNMTMPVRDFYPRVGVDYARHSYEEIARLWLDEFNKRAVGVGLIPGVLEVIRAMHAQGRSQSVLSASYEPSVRAQCAALLSLMPQLMGYYQHSAMGRKPVITNLAEARKYAGALFFGLHEERVYMICVDQSGRVLHPALMHRGTIDQVQIYPREVVETALRYHAHAVLLAHNHPSGMAEPSQDDYDSTRAVIGALNVIGVRVIDHLIFAGNSVYSMTQNSQFDGRQDEREISYIMRSRSVPGQRGTLREEQEDELIALQMDEWNGI